MLKLMKQECKGNCKFNGPVYMTAAFESEIGPDAVLEAYNLLKERIKLGADYLQVFTYEDKKFWVIDDITHVTFLLPSDY